MAEVSQVQYPTLHRQPCPSHKLDQRAGQLRAPPLYWVSRGPRCEVRGGRPSLPPPHLRHSRLKAVHDVATSFSPQLSPFPFWITGHIIATLTPQLTLLCLHRRCSCPSKRTKTPSPPTQAAGVCLGVYAQCMHKLHEYQVCNSEEDAAAVTVSVRHRHPWLPDFRRLLPGARLQCRRSLCRGGGTCAQVLPQPHGSGDPNICYIEEVVQ